MKKIVLFAMGLVLSSTTLAQEKVETTICGDFVNEYIWRGLKLADVAVQPTLGVGYKGLSLTAWGSYGLSNKDDVKEFDLTLAYSIGGLNFGTTPTARTTSSRVTSAMISDLPHYCGTPTLPATTTRRTASGPTVAILRQASPSSWLP